MDLLALAVIYIHDDKRQRFRRGKNANVNEWITNFLRVTKYLESDIFVSNSQSIFLYS